MQGKVSEVSVIQARWTENKCFDGETREEDTASRG